MVMFGLGMLVMYLIVACITILYDLGFYNNKFWFDEIMMVIFAWWIIVPCLLIKKIKKMIKKRGN